ncbi:hypothetical protein FZEAL_295 [Fusarium zealandicum]|uniref:GMP synthase n=1 Tax=Fusarium zealandicum TaxID=1053134 RepID=A0A8H4UV37_9HYPO|nr:hypothetical protein FZEAL_295 [Fusarium zealandicum]
MSKYKDLMKNGWHPEKSAGTSGGSIRGQVSGLLGRNKSSEESSDHVAVPISHLKDPSSFAPPPKRTGTGLGPPPPPRASTTTKDATTSQSNYQNPREAGGYQQAQSQQYYEEEEEPPAPRPYHVNTTGLSTDNLPKPPGRRDGADGRSPPPPSYQSATTAAAPAARPAPPSLPPRLPPRMNPGAAAPSPTPASPASTGNNLLNQGAVSRLSAAGISVPGLGIGRSSPAATASPSPPPPQRPGVASPHAAPSHMNELQNRFSKLGTSSKLNDANPPSEGTTWAQKQSALKTASSFQKDPSTVSLSDARTAATTANNFRQRHGEQVAAGAKTANGLNQKYGLMDKAKSSYASVQGTQSQGAEAGAASPSLAGLAGKKKPPPPPPKKKPGLGGAVASAAPADDGPPPIPMATRPQF